MSSVTSFTDCRRLGPLGHSRCYWSSNTVWTCWRRLATLRTIPGDDLVLSDESIFEGWCLHTMPFGSRCLKIYIRIFPLKNFTDMDMTTIRILDENFKLFF
jgi:hypothetical protein